MENNIEPFDWTSFYDFATDFHPTFRKELSKQLLDKISLKTNCNQFEKFDFLLLVGLDDLDMQIHNNKMYALISLVTPTSMSIFTWIYWYSEDASLDLSSLHKQDITNIPVIIEWNVDFPLEKVLSFMRPHRTDKPEKTGYSFKIEYYYYSFPDVSFEFHYKEPLNNTEIEKINEFITRFQSEWNKIYPDKAINYMNKLEHTNNNIHIVVADFGQKNNAKTLTQFFKSYNDSCKELPTLKICIK